MIDISKLLKKDASVEYFKNGQIIVKDGDTVCDTMYILLEGSADVYKNYRELGEVKIATLGKGEFFGEMSLFLNKRRTATIVANGDVYALAIDHENAHAFFEHQPEATYSLIQTLCARLEKTGANMADNSVKYEKNIITLNQEKTQLKDAANTDALTGAYNRRYFMTVAEPWIKDWTIKKRKPFVIMLDLDYFKKVNDTFGHPAGDAVLKNVVTRVNSSIRSGDLLARYGGEEFILLVACTTKEDAQELVERIRNNVKEGPIEFEDKRIPITASFGVAAVLPETDLNTVISFADKALYRAKTEGRDRAVFYE